MGETTWIEWCDHTFNGWRGCFKISPGCANCYAEAGSHRNPAVLGGWGANPRVVGTDAYWRQPILWDRRANAEGIRRRVFALSLGDWLEDHPDLVEPRARLLGLIRDTPNLDWLLVTKRPEGWSDRLHEVVRETHDGADVFASAWLDGDAPENVWALTSVENADYLWRAEAIQDIPALVHGLSVEPLLGYLGRLDLSGIDWVIVGGESGSHARPMHPDWARSIRDQCQAAGVPFFLKQWGEWAPLDQVPGLFGRRTSPEVGRVLRWPFGLGETSMARVGKRAAGRLLDGREWSEFPAPAGSEVAR